MPRTTQPKAASSAYEQSRIERIRMLQEQMSGVLQVRFESRLGAVRIWSFSGLCRCTSLHTTSDIFYSPTGIQRVAYDGGEAGTQEGRPQACSEAYDARQRYACCTEQRAHSNSTSVLCSCVLPCVGHELLCDGGLRRSPSDRSPMVP